MCREDSEISELHRPRLEVVDPDGLAVLRGAASPSLRRAVLNGVFRDTELTQGQCGGDQMQGKVRGVDGQPWGAEASGASFRAPLGTAMGVQGQFLLDEEIAAGAFAEGPLGQLQRILSGQADVLRDFVADTAEVSYINTTQPERVNTKRTWCGWSFDGDLTKSPVREEVWTKRGGAWTYSGDAVPKVFLSLGSHAVTWGFKYSKAEGSCLECRVEPGDALIRWGAARSWCSALVGIDAKRGPEDPDAPFTFAQVKLASHAALKRGNPQLWGKIHDTSKYRGAPFEANRWFQYSFQYVGDNQVEIFRPGSRFQPGPRVAQPSVEASGAAKPGADGAKRWGKKGLAAPSDADAKKIKTEDPAAAKMRALHAKLARFCSDDSLIKGWEVERRTCNGKARGPLRGAARDIRVKAAAAQRAPGAAGPEAQYLQAIEVLHAELAKAREQDFDSLLKDGYDWLTAKLEKVPQAEDGDPAPRGDVEGSALKGDVGVSEKTWERHTKMCTELLAQLKQHRAHGQHGRAADRDMRKAVQWADKIRVARAQLKRGATEDLEVAYLRAVEGLLEELMKEGEADFDGLLRHAVNFLEHGGRKLAV